MTVRQVMLAAMLVGGLASFAAADPPVVPARLDVKPGKPALFDVRIDPAKKAVFARGFDLNDCVVVRLHSDDPAVMSFMAIPDKPGTYYLSFITVGEATFSQCVIVVGGAPVPPGPTDPLAAALQRAFTADNGAVADAQSLAGVYRRAVTAGGLVDTAATKAALLTAMHAEAVKAVPATKLKGVREAIATELDAKLGTDPGGAIDRTAARTQFTLVAGLLEVLK